MATEHGPEYKKNICFSQVLYAYRLFTMCVCGFMHNWLNLFQKPDSDLRGAQVSRSLSPPTLSFRLTSLRCLCPLLSPLDTS